MTTLEITLSITTVVFFILFIMALFEIKKDFEFTNRYRKLANDQKDLINTISKNYNELLIKSVGLKLKNEEDNKMRNAIEEFIENCSEEIELEHFKEKLKEALK